MSLQSQSRTRIHDPGAELLDRLQSLWVSFGRVILVSIGVLAAAGVIAYFVLQTRGRAEEQAAGALAEANILYWQGDYARSREAAQRVITQHAGTPSGIDALRIAGDDAYWMGEFAAAAESYRQYLERRRSGLVADGVRRSYAYALESSGQPAAAAKEYEAVVGRFDRESSAELLMAAARCYQTMGQGAEARTRLQRLLDEYGETTYAQTARVRLGEMGAGR